MLPGSVLGASDLLGTPTILWVRLTLLVQKWERDWSSLAISKRHWAAELRLEPKSCWVTAELGLFFFFKICGDAGDSFVKLCLGQALEQDWLEVQCSMLPSDSKDSDLLLQSLFIVGIKGSAQNSPAGKLLPCFEGLVFFPLLCPIDNCSYVLCIQSLLTNSLSSSKYIHLINKYVLSSS